MAKSSFDGALIHFGAVRMRVVGTGNLTLSLNSLDSIHVSNLPNIAMVTTTNRQPTVLSNYTDQMGALEFRTTEINERFTISKIVIFIQPVFTGYPQ